VNASHCQKALLLQNTEATEDDDQPAKVATPAANGEEVKPSYR